MNLKDILLKIHNALEGAHIEHALIGAFAMAHYGVQRATGDIDFLIDEIDRQKALEALQNLGFKIFHETEEVIRLSKNESTAKNDFCRILRVFGSIFYE